MKTTQDTNIWMEQSSEDEQTLDTLSTLWVVGSLASGVGVGANRGNVETIHSMCLTMHKKEVASQNKILTSLLKETGEPSAWIRLLKVDGALALERDRENIKG